MIRRLRNIYNMFIRNFLHFYNKEILFLIVTAFAVMLVYTLYEGLPAIALRNWGWLTLTEGITSYQQDNCNKCTTAISAFSKLLKKNHDEGIAQGLGLALFLRGQTLKSQLIWSSIYHPTRVLAVANWLNNHKQAELALKLLSNYSLHSRGGLVDIQSYIGLVCQKQFVIINRATGNDSTRNTCNDYWAKTPDGLIVDGQFETTSLQFWRQRFTKGSKYTIDRQTGTPLPSLRIHTVKNTYHGGVFQELVLPKGTKLIYSVRLRIRPEAAFRVLPLYIRYQQNGETKIGAGAPIARRTEWLYLERSFTAPGSDGDRYTFYPAFVSGIGEIWIDDVRLVPVENIERK